MGKKKPKRKRGQRASRRKAKGNSGKNSPGAALLQEGLMPGARSLCRTVRQALGWTQGEMATHLGVSRKAVESYEQRWRKTPLNVERLALLFLGSLSAMSGRKKAVCCWELKRCALESRRNCPTWQSRRGDICWLLAGTYCDGRKMRSWKEKWERCKRCGVLRLHFSDTTPPRGRGGKAKKK